jgi:hypothetical protein
MPRPKKKIKTSVCISPKALRIIKQIATREDRSVSYVLERFMEQMARSLEHGK